MSRIYLKKPGEIKKIAAGGKKLNKILNQLLDHVKPGIRLQTLEKKAWQMIAKSGGGPAFAKVPGYRWATCINVNDGIVHGIPDDYEIKPFDVVTVDVGIFYQGWNTDVSATVFVDDGSNDSSLKKRSLSRKLVNHFLKTGKIALSKAIDQARPGNRIGHISLEIQKYIEKAGYSILEDLTGHGVGRQLHEWPPIPCFLDRPINSTPIIKTGMVLAVEVIYALGKNETIIDNDGWTIRMKDGKISAVFEKTIAILDDGPLICT